MIPHPDAAPRRPWVRWMAVGTLAVGACALLWLPAETRQGINFTVRVHRLPLYVKVLRFLIGIASIER